MHHVHAGVWGGKRASDPLELLSQAVVYQQIWVLGTEP